MKNILYLIIMLTFFSCEFENNKQNKLTEPILENVKLSMPNKFTNNIFGEWGIYKQVGIEYTTNCNVCPTIEFKNSEYAQLILPSKDIESYEWSISKDILILKFVDTGSDQYLPNGECRMKLEEHEEYFELTLLLNENNGFVLRK